jgi:hypothetical protein
MTAKRDETKRNDKRQEQSCCQNRVTFSGSPIAKGNTVTDVHFTTSTDHDSGYELRVIKGR